MHIFLGILLVGAALLFGAVMTAVRIRDHRWTAQDDANVDAWFARRRARRR